MLYMVIERFDQKKFPAMGKRFQQEGRMLPEGVLYHQSWIDSAGTKCFQILEASRPELLREWMNKWNDLVDFEVVPVLTSAEFWEGRASASQANAT